MICNCRPAEVDSIGQVLSIGTCPVCLPPGAITWLIENGRQLDMFSDPADSGVANEEIVPQVDKLGSVSASVAVAVMRPDYKSHGLCSCDLPF